MNKRQLLESMDLMPDDGESVKVIRHEPVEPRPQQPKKFFPPLPMPAKSGQFQMTLGDYWKISRPLPKPPATPALSTEPPKRAIMMPRFAISTPPSYQLKGVLLPATFDSIHIGRHGTMWLDPTKGEVAIAIKDGYFIFRQPVYSSIVSYMKLGYERGLTEIQVTSIITNELVGLARAVS